MGFAVGRDQGEHLACALQPDAGPTCTSSATQGVAGLTRKTGNVKRREKEKERRAGKTWEQKRGDGKRAGMRGGTWESKNGQSAVAEAAKPVELYVLACLLTGRGAPGKGGGGEGAEGEERNGRLADL